MSDRGCVGKANRDLVEGKICLVNTGLLKKRGNEIFVNFVFNEKGMKVLRCPADIPEENNSSPIFFLREQCAGC